MIVYRSPERAIEVAPLLDRLHDHARRDAAGHDTLVELLIDFGEFEAALADGQSPDADADTPMTRALRDVALALGRALRGSWRGTPAPRRRRRWPVLAGALARLVSAELPSRLTVRVPEGYAYYGLYPETYVAAAECFARERASPSVVCIGIRSIGTSLSAAVGGALQERGCAVAAYTVRPRGHPFDRMLRLSPALEAALRARSASHFLVIDEGPGLSGSSITCVASALSALGVPDERIALFPSWNADAERFRSAAARARWPRHRKYVVPFEDLLSSGSGWLGGPPAGTEARTDVSGGEWRRLLYADEREWPAVQPQHERRKYLVGSAPAAGGRRGDTLGMRMAATGPARHAWRLFKFAGLGSYGRAKLARAEQLADAGFGPPVLGLAHGFLIMPLLDGTPLRAGEIDSELLGTMARYLAFLVRCSPAELPPRFDDDLEMMRINIAAGLGDPWAERLAGFEKYRAAAVERSAVVTDGRMMPHEWLRTPGGYVKTDGVDHHDDHFFPGCQDIAWDAAGCCVEFDMPAAARGELVARYTALAHDDSLARRLPFYIVAYLAYRFGYATMGADALGQSRDGDGLRALAQRYGRLLRAELEAAS